MHSVTSNAVAEAVGDWETLVEVSGSLLIRGKIAKDGAYMSMWMQGFYGNYGQALCSIPQKYLDRMSKVVARFYFFQDPNTICICNIDADHREIYYYPANGSLPSYGSCLVKLE